MSRVTLGRFARHAFVVTKSEKQFGRPVTDTKSVDVSRSVWFGFGFRDRTPSIDSSGGEQH